MEERDRGETTIDPKELAKLRRRSRQYLEIKKRVFEGQRLIQFTAREDGNYGGAAMGVLGEISGIISRKDEESKELLPKKERQGLTTNDVLGLVYEELAASGKVIKRFGVKFALFDDSDWHRTDICYFGGNGVVIEIASGKRVALTVGKPVERRWKTGFERGLIYTALNTGDPVTGKKGLESVLQRALLAENKGLHVFEGALFLHGQEVPREYAVELRESEELFRGQGRLEHIVFVGEKGEEVPPNLRPEIVISGYKEEIVPYLIKRIEEEFGIEELPKLTSPSGEFTENISVIK